MLNNFKYFQPNIGWMLVGRTKVMVLWVVTIHCNPKILEDQTHSKKDDVFYIVRKENTNW